MNRLALLSSVTVAALTSSLSGQVVTLEFIAQGNMWHTDISEAGSIVFARNEGSLTRLFRYTDGIGEEMLDIGDRDSVWRSKINSAGQVVFHGTVDDTPAALRFTDGIGVEVLSPPDASYSLAYSINELGQVTGSMQPSYGEASPFRFTDGQGMELIDLGPEDYYAARGNAINLSGMIAGTGEHRGTRGQVAFRYSDADGVEFLGDLGGSMWVAGMNNHGDVTGMGELPDGSGLHAYLYTDDDGLVDIGGFGNGHHGEVFDINDSRWIVGHNPTETEPMLWTPDTGWLELNSILPPDLDADLVTAMGINNANQIVGNGKIDGVYGIYRLTIHSIPGPLTLAPLVLVGLGWNGRRSR